ncbi:DUF551 domain-containing protein [Cronobacter sakazakii]
MSTISNERLEEITNDKMINQGSDFAKMATELLALRKERERAEPDYYVVVTSVGVWQSFHRNRAEAEFIVNKPFHHGYSVLEIYTAPPVTDERYQQLSELYHAQEKRLFKLAQRIKGLSFDKYAHSPSQAIDVLEAAIFGEADEDGRTAMLHSVMQPCDKCGLTGIHACMGGMEADTTSHQFESLAFKSVVPIGYLQGHKDGLEWAARLAEANHPQTSDWLYDDPLELAKAIRKGPDMPGSTVDGWIPCSERMPEVGDIVLTAYNGCVNVGEMERSGASCRYFTSVVSGRELPATHWQPLPEPPCK